DEKVVRAAIEQVNIGMDADRSAALRAIKQGGDAALLILVEDLTTGDETASETARGLLPIFSKDATDVLLAALDGAPESALVPAAAALVEMDDPRVGPALAARYYRGVKSTAAKEALETALGEFYGKMPTPNVVASDLNAKAKEFYRRKGVFPLVVDGSVERWRWDAATQAPARESVPLDDANAIAAAEYAREAAAIVANNNLSAPADYRRLAYAAQAERLLGEFGLDAGADAVAAFDAVFPNLSVQELEGAIEYAVRSGRPLGGVIPAICLRARGNEELCYSSDGEPRVIVEAAFSNDRRLRFEALATIVAWNPSRSFVGASRVANLLNWFATGSGSRVAVVASPKLADAGALGNVFTQLGYKVVVASSGRDLLLRAQENADVEIAFAASDLNSP
ncbi:MAG: hypothetical protein HUK22_05325, partial [Thermoguttaceae bacterium]|nr:hypothetical protein [Thermoguttaceae bacterium]